MYSRYFHYTSLIIINVHFYHPLGAVATIRSNANRSFTIIVMKTASAHISDITQFYDMTQHQ